ncbi:MAG: hypothetical protein GX638_05995 [Crenarchaeota archaeon]|nr:hypothetical protein [Thermoproteota archaeon]
MTLMDLALETKDFEWAKQICNLDDKSLTENNEIKCELADSKVEETKNKNEDYSNLSRGDIIKLLDEQNLLLPYLELQEYIQGLDDDTKWLIVRQCVSSNKDAEIALKIIKILDQ